MYRYYPSIIVSQQLGKSEWKNIFDQHHLNDRTHLPNGPLRLSICHQRAVQKRKISQIVLNTKTYFVLNCNVLALFTFYAPPSGGKSKGAVVHYKVLYVVRERERQICCSCRRPIKLLKRRGASFGFHSFIHFF